MMTKISHLVERKGVQSLCYNVYLPSATPCCGIFLLYTVSRYYPHWLIIKLIVLKQGRIKLGGKIKPRTQMKKGESGEEPVSPPRNKILEDR